MKSIASENKTGGSVTVVEIFLFFIPISLLGAPADILQADDVAISRSQWQTKWKIIRRCKQGKRSPVAWIQNNWKKSSQLLN